ncbi:Metallo-dependent phosphatase-like protein [Dactylonectria macrodidyma]|uniref:Endopolyphosphatase n=1 Tax=Dactylonectria macrodidyma TaxID=307937 RepID=A0A9P9EAK8_9HYPO|nr:Metallo-dependent phosphatase-like protein [Dactylonectria macrodidyma]
MATSGARLLVAAALLFPAVFSSPIYDDSQRTLAIAESDDAASSVTPPLHLQTKQNRKLQGRFLHITDFHPDEFYKPHTSTDEGIACHRKRGAAGTYGAETTDCDSPLSLIDATLDWIRENVKDDIDFVIWTGDTARHDSDEKLPRNTSDVLGTNRLVSQKVIDTFSDNGQLTIPIIPTFGNNDFLPHNIFYPGPNKWLQAYTQIWHRFIPEEQRHSFGFGGWFEVEVIPNKLSVFSLNTMYFFDRNAGVDGCAEPTEPGFKHLEWLSIQLQRVRERGMKAMLIGHVPPARTGSKQNWDETCWQKYTLWLRQYRDVVAGAFYGHMNIDHFLLQDTNEIDLSLLGGDSAARDSIEEDYSVDSKGDYLQELRQSWTDLPGSAAAAADYFGGNEDDDDDDDTHDEGVDESGKKKKKKNKKKKGLKKIGGKYGERYQLSLVSPSIVPNFFPTIRVIEYNISGVEDTPVWADSFDINSEAPTENLELYDEEEDGEQVHLELKRDLEAERKKNKKKKGKKKKPKKPKNPSLIIPPDPAKGSLPGPAYAPQPFSLTGYTQYFANLTYINNDMTDPIDGARWRNGDFSDRDPKHSPPKPREFKFEVEYSTFTDKIYKLHDLTVRSYLRLAYRIGKHEAKKGTGNPVELENDDFEDDEDESDSLELETNDAEEDSGNSEEDSEADSQRKGKKHKKNRKNKKNKKKKGEEKVNKVWRQFLQRAFVSTISKKDLKKLTE